MRFSFATALVLGLATESVVGSTWFGKAAYNKWHETELERWLSDHDVPFPTASDRKDLQDLVKAHWEDKVATPYNSWDSNQLQSYLSKQGQKVKAGTEKNKDSLLSQVKSYWSETADQASDSYSSVQDWIFDSWTESELKSFLDYHGIPNPSPRTRDSLLTSVRSNYQAAANKIGETAAYPGDWLYQSWSDSDLKAYLDERGIPVPQNGNRDKLIASVRRNARTASNKAADLASTASASASSLAAGASAAVSDKLLDSWSDSDIKAWADKNGIKVPQGSKRNELLALARKHSAKLTGDTVVSSASSAYGAATTSAGNQFASATGGLYNQGKYWYDWALNQIGMGSEEAKASLLSVSSVASSSASSASSVASNSALSGSKVASSSLSSGSSAASKSASSKASSISKSGQGAAGKATDAAYEAASSAKHAASEAAQRATDRVKEEL